MFPLRTIGGRTGWTLAYPEAGKAFSALSLAAATAGAAAALLSVARMLGCEEGGSALPNSAICGILAVNACLDSSFELILFPSFSQRAVPPQLRCPRGEEVILEVSPEPMAYSTCTPVLRREKPQQSCRILTTTRVLPQHARPLPAATLLDCSPRRTSNGPTQRGT